ncbi:hypothetical protein [Mycobacterium pseudokansasii]|nr:hypothetical protein [Mycobacterium pseudokansasii]
MSCALSPNEEANYVFDFTESILIHAPHEKVWNVVRDIDEWWLPVESRP